MYLSVRVREKGGEETCRGQRYGTTEPDVAAPPLTVAESLAASQPSGSGRDIMTAEC